MIETFLINSVNPESIGSELGQETEKWEEDFSDLDQIDITETFENRYSEKLNHLKETSDELQNIQATKMSELQKLNEEFGGMDDAIKSLESEQKLLLIIQEILNRIIETLNEFGIELDTLSIEKIENIDAELTKLKAEISETSLKISERIKILETTQSKLQSIEKEINATNREFGIYETRYKAITDELDEQMKEKNLTSEDKEAIHDHIKTLITELEKTKNLSDEEIVNTIREVDSIIFKSIENVQKELGDFDVDYEEIFENTAIGAGVGAGVGAVPGAIIGALSGAAGEIARQTTLYFGASEGVAMGVQVVTEAVGGTGLVKVIGKEFGEVVLKHADDIAGGVKSVGKEVLEKSDDVLQQGTRYVGDKTKTIEYEVKGIINDWKTHEFIDGNGKVLVGKIQDVVDIKRSIKMPYLGSDLPNTNSAGYLRDSVKFAKQYLDEFPETMSKFNAERIKNGLSPRVDKQWVEYNPNHKTFIGETLHHHHLNNTGLAAYVPKTLHNGPINKRIMHVD